MLALNTAKTLWVQITHRIPFVFETPQPKPDAPNITKLDECVEILAHPEVKTKTVHQCRFGARATKPTILVYFLVALIAEDAYCNHPAKWWRTPSSGKWSWGAHAPLFGREWAVPSDE